MQVKDTIRKLRKENNYTQVDLAEKLSCNRQKVADWERGKSTPSADDLILLAKIFNTSTDYLLGLSGVASLDPEIYSIHEVTGLSEKSIEILKNIHLTRRTAYIEIINYLIEETDYILNKRTELRINISILRSLYEYFFFKKPKKEYIVSLDGDMVDVTGWENDPDLEYILSEDDSMRVSTSDDNEEIDDFDARKVFAADLLESYKFQNLTEQIKESKDKYMKQKGEQHGDHSKKE